MKRDPNALLSFGEFRKEVRLYGWNVAFTNWLICFTKWYAKADRIRLEYKNDELVSGRIIRSRQTFKEDQENG